MKALVGVDLSDMHRPALDLFLRLGIPEAHLTLLHAIEPMPQYAPPLTIGEPTVGGWMSHLRDAGKEALSKACGDLASAGVACETAVADGAAAGALIHEAELRGADLIVVGSVRQDRLSAFLFGSVARALTVGARQSLLITKEPAEPSAEPLTAVLATDHSDYANRCLDRFLAWAPKGVRHIHVVTAYDQRQAGRHPRTNEDEAEGGLHAANRRVADRLEQLRYAVSTDVVKGHPNEVMRREMQARDADLLIVGAQGHGFLERLMVGSVSLHQVLAERYPVLLIRV